MTRTWKFLILFSILLWGSLLLMGGISLTGGGQFPVNGIMLIDAGTCPASFAEVTVAQGRFLVGTPAAGTVAGTLGTAGGNLANASFTPVGSVASHNHGLFAGATIQSDGTGPTVLNRGNVAKTDTTGTNFTDATMTNLSEATTPGFTGTANTTMRSVIAPYVQLVLCKRTS